MGLRRRSERRKERELVRLLVALERLAGETRTGRARRATAALLSAR